MILPRRRHARHPSGGTPAPPTTPPNPPESAPRPAIRPHDRASSYHPQVSISDLQNRSEPVQQPFDAKRRLRRLVDSREMELLEDAQLAATARRAAALLSAAKRVAEQVAQRN
eukprot:CAMPEP_0180063862 /NCGR_PEP_ID=MMETSP0985-20121206/7868_1 /TAXON_ID=483367 /ORGANISM="non described non described, Strain CCMP 2436" /LENGTH=112 /DNA_ID=CAMNT_0021994113 /DNA_START=24 /DNA_END=362 /DNA_ORIENTATION=+